jgi:hypothetical protein
VENGEQKEMSSSADVFSFFFVLSFFFLLFSFLEIKATFFRSLCCITILLWALPMLDKDISQWFLLRPVLLLPLFMGVDLGLSSVVPEITFFFSVFFFLPAKW